MTDTDSCSACNSWWRLPVLLAIVLGAIIFLFPRGAPEPAAQRQQAAPEKVTAPPGAQSVRLTINFGDDRAPLELTSRWHEDMTVADLLNSEPRVSLTTTGAGAFLTSLNGVANEGAGERNWTYRVNGKHADRSFAVFELRPGDQVLWTFAPQQ